MTPTRDLLIVWQHLLPSEMDVEELPGVELPADVEMVPAEPVAAADKRPSSTKFYSSRCRMQALEYDL